MRPLYDTALRGEGGEGGGEGGEEMLGNELEGEEVGQLGRGEGGGEGPVGIDNEQYIIN